MADTSSERIEHLKLLQAVLTPMADTCAAMKRSCITVTAAALALAAGAGLPLVALLAVPLVAIFWALDAVYLRQESWSRKLYDDSVAGTTPQFQLTRPEDLRRSIGLGATLGSWATFGLYLPLIAFLPVVWLVLGVMGGG